MARRIPWRRNCPDAVKERIEQASQARIYLLRETGPTGFLVKEDGIDRKFKVFLGDEHTCTCQTFAKERELCIHILWILLKKFRVPKENQIIFQLSLVEREINEVMRGCYARSSKKNPGKDVTTDDREKLKQKEIDEEDVCPICQDEFMQQPEPLTYCKYGCGNSVHIKCMKVWAEHQRSTGETIVKCPLCRVDFGTFQGLMDEFRKSSRRNTRAERQDLHLGATCKRCRMCPIAGKCYRCVVCADYHLCHTCFATDTHCQHSFQCRQKPSERWRPASRLTMLPNAVISDLQNRDISDGDYDLLLQLDRQVTDQDGIPAHVVQNLPTEVLQERHRFLTDGTKCSICLQGFQRYQSVRTLPCHHPFHVSCIDSWLSNHSQCPVDSSYVGSVITSSHVRQNTRSRTVPGIGEFTIGSSVVGGPIAGKKIGQKARISRGNSDSVATLPSSFTLSGSGLMVQSKHNRPNEVVQFSDYANTTVETPLLDGQRYTTSLALRQNSQRAFPVNSAGSGKTGTQAGPSSGVNKFTRHKITFGSVNSKPPIPPHSVGNFRSSSGDSRRSKSKLTEKMKRISLDGTQRSNSEGDLSLFAAGTAVQASEVSPGREHKRGRLVKSKLVSQNSSQSLSDPGLAVNLETIMASGISVQLPPVDVD